MPRPDDTGPREPKEFRSLPGGRYADRETKHFPAFDDPTGRGGGFKVVKDRDGKSYRGMRMTAWDWKIANSRGLVWLEGQFMSWVRAHRRSRRIV